MSCTNLISSCRCQGIYQGVTRVVRGRGVYAEDGHSSFGPAEDGGRGTGAVGHLVVGVVRLKIVNERSYGNSLYTYFSKGCNTKK